MRAGFYSGHNSPHHGALGRVGRGERKFNGDFVDVQVVRSELLLVGVGNVAEEWVLSWFLFC